MWSSIFPSSLLVLALCAGCEEEPDVLLEITRASDTTGVSLALRTETGAFGPLKVLLASGGPRSLTVGFYFDGDEPTMIMRLLTNDPIRCDVVRVPTDGSVTSLSYALPEGRVSCDGCTTETCVP